MATMGLGASQCRHQVGAMNTSLWLHDQQQKMHFQKRHDVLYNIYSYTFSITEFNRQGTLKK